MERRAATAWGVTADRSTLDFMRCQLRGRILVSIKLRVAILAFVMKVRKLTNLKGLKVCSEPGLKKQRGPGVPRG